MYYDSGSDDNEVILCIPQSSSVTGVSSSGGLMSYQNIQGWGLQSSCYGSMTRVTLVSRNFVRRCNKINTTQLEYIVLIFRALFIKILIETIIRPNLARLFEPASELNWSDMIRVGLLQATPTGLIIGIASEPHMNSLSDNFI